MLVQRLSPVPPPIIPSMIDNLSSADRTELQTLASYTPHAAACKLVEQALSASVYSFVYTFDDSPVVLGGLHRTNDWPFAAWVIAATPVLAHHKKTFLKYSREELETMVGTARRPVRAHVDERWAKSLVWLRWLGFEKVGEFEVRGRRGVIMEFKEFRA